jgi:hypothetical protein
LPGGFRDGTTVHHRDEGFETFQVHWSSSIQ